MNRKPAGTKQKPPRPTIGWREWVALPDLGVDAIAVKVDTGARSSALHAFDTRSFEKGGVEYVRFTIHPVKRNSTVSIEAEYPVLARRWVTSSSGHRSRRPVIRTRIQLLGQEWPIEVTLTNRDAMGFRMLLGRQAISRRFLVDVSKSYLGGKKP
ncbi:MAG: ATP-dependent zinc protease family protein [Gemmatimonadota bacterium]